MEVRNIKNAAAIANDKVTTLRAVYYEQHTNAFAEKAYTFRVTKSLAGKLKKDDLVIVESKNHFDVVKVTEIHIESDIDLNGIEITKWALGKLPEDESIKSYQDLEADLISQHKDNQRRKLRESIVADYFGTQAIENMNEKPAQNEVEVCKAAPSMDG